MDFHLAPAYGRDYKNAKEVHSDWNAGKDFILAVTGQYCSKRDLDEMPGDVWIRYRKLQAVVRVK